MSGSADDEIINEMMRLYAELPTVECQGLCRNTCGPIDMSDAERRRIADAGHAIPPFTHEAHVRWRADEPLRCPALTSLGRCAVYEIRPLICRLWGVGRDTLACAHGCKVTGRRITTTQAMMLLQRSYAIGDDHTNDRTDKWSVLSDVMNDPDLGPMMLRLVKGDDSVYGALVEALRKRQDHES